MVTVICPFHAALKQLKLRPRRSALPFKSLSRQSILARIMHEPEHREWKRDHAPRQTPKTIKGQICLELASNPSWHPEGMGL